MTPFRSDRPLHSRGKSRACTSHFNFLPPKKKKIDDTDAALECQTSQPDVLAVGGEDRDSVLGMSASSDCPSGFRDCPVPSSGCSEADMSVNVLQTSANDVGSIVKPTMSPRDIDTAIQLLSTGERYTLLKHHNKPSSSYVFPTTYLGGCNRSFQGSVREEYPWMVYSILLDGAFCIACVFCTNRTNKGQFVNHPFRTWHKKSEKCKDQEALHLANVFTRKVDHPDTTVVALIDKG